jgi:exopolysaccharide biosynthesis polyprenyl glycosylphosphotransferase
MTAPTAQTSGESEGGRAPVGIRRGVLADAFSGPFFWTFVLPILDSLVLLACLLVSTRVRLGYLPGGEEGRGGWISYIIYGLCVLYGIAVCGAYRKPVHLRRLSAAAEFILGTALATAGALFIIYVVFLGTEKVVQESRAVLLLSSAAFIPAALITREIISRIHNRLARSRPYLLIGREDSLREFSSTYAGTGLKNPVISMKIENLPSPVDGMPGGSPLFWNEVGLRYEAVILTEPPERISPVLIEKLVRMHFSQLPVLTLNAFYSLMWRQVPTLHLNPSWVFEQDFSLAERSHYCFIKRGVDILLSFFLLAGLLPLLVLIAMAIKLDSRGPVLFRQSRVGRNRRIFPIMKFRTMVVGADAGPAYTSGCDPRVTRVGRILRKLRIDEVPQLFNVLSGDMSLIGPRPEWERLVSVYEKQIPFYHLRHLVKPGITGWAQLNFRYGESLEDAMEKLRFDLYYIRFYSPVLDLEIVLKTVLHILSIRGR